MDPIIGAALISGGTGLLSNLFGGSKSKGSESTVPVQGKWDPDEKKIWDAAMAQIFGDADTPTLRDQIGADDQYQRNAYDDFFRKSGKATQGFLDQLGDAKRMYLSNPVSGSIGGQGVKFIPKSSARSFGNLADYAQQVLGAQDVYDTRVLNYNKEYTPYRANRNYLDFLLPLATSGQAHTWGQQTNAAYEPSLLNDISTGINAIAPAFQNVFNKKAEQTTPEDIMQNLIDSGYGA